ncbi:MAG: hypothetical protein RLZZ230_556 [Candidatus Parcubacteria bacterium]|jgi:hypothetical protein
MLKHIQDEEQIEEMRKRLYDRGSEVEKTVRHELSETKVDITRDWAATKSDRRTSDLRVGMTAAPADSRADAEDGFITEKPKRRYRTFIMLGSFIIFALVAVVTGLYVYFGGNSVSGDNIKIAIEGKSLIGGGEQMDFQVAVTNDNSVSIEAATLIVKYPPGTKSTGDSPHNVYEERIPLNQIAPGATQNIPLQVLVYGEENAEQIISATLEYRITGSNGTFNKEAPTLAYRISSSPLTIRVDNIEKVASGQLIDVVVTIDSNASTPLNDILLVASYPDGFSLDTADPEPSYGKNVWKIKELLPEQSVQIKLRGVVSGLTEEQLHINFQAGPANVDNQFVVDAVLDELQVGFQIEQPFIDVDIAIDNDHDRAAVVGEGKESYVNLVVKNTLSETVYDMAVEVVLAGNALDEKSIKNSDGFYDSNKGTIRWEVSNNDTFARILPGDSRLLKFSVVPNSLRTAATYGLEVNVYARRVADSSALETLIGSNKAEAKYSTHVALSSQVGRNSSRFTDSGPIPPQVGEVTTYTLTMVAEAGANDVSGVVVETSLPLYVNWLNEVEANGSVIYNDVSKQIEWKVGDMKQGERKEANFQVSFTPSVSQIRSTAVLLNKQNLKAEDGFTKSLLQDSVLPVTTELSTEMGFIKGNGVVIE